MNRDPTAACHRTDAQCNLCGAGMHAAAGAPCPQCASTPRQRLMRSAFQALPHGLLAWRTLAPASGPHGLDARWFTGRATPADLAVASLPGALDALDALSARGVVYVDGDGDGAALPAQLALNAASCTLIAIDAGDRRTAGGGARLCASLLLRDAADAARWLPYLQAWHGPGAVTASVVDDPFAPLRTELAVWQAEGRECSFWWRDDDLVADSPALRRLAALSQRHAAPVLVAVIPEQADAALACATGEGMPTLVFCQHGWGHVNHAAADQPNSEFGPGREQEEAEADLARGSARMRALFGERFMPVMVPPWNKLAPALAARLPALGLAGVSQYLSEPHAPVDGLVRIDTHLDIVDWRNGAGVRDPAALIERLVAILQMGRNGQLREPVGVLSHHRVMADGTWRFLDRLLAVTAEFACVRWLHPHEVFQGMNSMLHQEAPCAA
ncbi:hypothetical protein HF313_19720 [Massilia atriviolacea]|uniref:Polysaccharide deacetylase n=1 Tax=Massilia atriviolacea TaxID=2495579 RepID=A0A430HSH8_9BURK|nr:polysaccharide deacetylase family protein [Massilia atriviolacea]RSZ60470.1 hypothetical protein EJB06_04985 [Massilia atriviolacea]